VIADEGEQSADSVPYRPRHSAGRCTRTGHRPRRLHDEAVFFREISRAVPLCAAASTDPTSTPIAHRRPGPGLANPRSQPLRRGESLKPAKVTAARNRGRFQPIEAKTWTGRFGRRCSEANDDATLHQVCRLAESQQHRGEGATSLETISVVVPLHHYPDQLAS
jgi:hypothetical protein